MYRHFYIRFTDLLNLTGLVRAGRLDFTRLRASDPALVDLAGSSDPAEDYLRLQPAHRRWPASAAGALWCARPVSEPT